MIRVLLVVAALLAFPVLEGWLLFRLGERFGWPVTLESTPGRGTVATIRFD